ncbi:hypothetical protein WICANDRAFT_92568 [Wickerhamomyces anomalus NRRL Y-366-8]|uniref:Sm domain-containing protein n=1 Tax=Wickerhamomyces anomalus (strain ATCC 58044 / CBS 1984 / NCYC 433 / NRRL Y-366-8) TaxID=683960 RepID=A0A1E3P4S4_WICAA|nr:uncharacterized protein WICANDRAFT_92568 [Wickerhamomyces anomalus NRRL Y-366-8]ODQ60280.1 hypothetical protein WICANDRAFT_92568 [Wickerhamomyces anomalus NRRL Y-366-8]
MSLDILAPGDLIGTELKIKIKDQRELVGILLALDNKPNLLINNVIEYSFQQGNLNKRELGLVSVPFDSITTVKINNSDLDKTIKWKSNLI